MNPLTQLKKKYTNSATSHRIGAVGLAVVLVAAVMAGQAQADRATRDLSSVYVFGTSQIIPGASSSLVRYDNGVSMMLSTNGLAPGSATTMWWVVFNNPEFCTHGVPGVSRCGVGDLPPFGGDPNVGGSLLYATGHVIGGDGIGDFGDSLSEGDTTGAVFGPGLLDSRRADIHLVVRTHGQAIRGLIREQISSFNGGCPPNECVNLQFAVHEGN